MVELAQLVEHQIVVLRVVGSSPTFHPSFRPKGLHLGAPAYKDIKLTL